MNFSSLKKFIAEILIGLAFLMEAGYCQQQTIPKIQEALDSLQLTRPLEKLYVHLDKSDYLLGDTIWYKAYVMDGVTGGFSPMSGVVYVELIDGEGNLVQRSRQVLVAASTHGEFVLDPTVVKPGRFQLRAYTRWLQNFGADYFYQRAVQVSGDYFQEWTVDLAPVAIMDTLGNRKVSVALGLNEIDGRRVAVQPVTVELVHRGKAIAQLRKVIDTLGRLEILFELPARRAVEDLEMVVRTEDIEKVRFPLRDGLPAKGYDVQFLPESGQWLPNMPA